MVSVDDIAAKWEERAANQGSLWKTRTENAVDDFRQGLMEIDGISNVGIVEEFEDGVDRVSARDFNEAVRGNTQKFRDNFVAGVEDSA